MHRPESIKELLLLRLCRAGVRADVADEIAMEFDGLVAERTARAMGQFLAKETARGQLTEAEFEVFELAVEGRTDAEIARLLGISRSAVEQRKSSGRVRLAARTTSQAIGLLFADRKPQKSLVE